MNDAPHKRRPALRRAAFRVLLVGACFAVWYLLIYPKSPLTDAWNPLQPLSVEDDLTPMTGWKLGIALRGRESCLAALDTGADAKSLPDFEKSDVCHIRPRVDLRTVGQSRLDPVKTRCQTALRFAMWERHGVQPAAEQHLGTGVREISHFSSYNCRAMRTSQGDTGRMSTHATADAIDISGFILNDGRRVTLTRNWDAPAAEAAFLRAVRDSACDWFRVTLGPDYNALHADHFHLQHTGWGLCR